MSNGEERIPTMNETTPNEPLRSGRLLADRLQAEYIRQVARNNAQHLIGELSKLSLVTAALFLFFR